MSAVAAQPVGQDAAQLALSTLQAAYNANTTPPQIVINATPDPLALMASVAGPVLQVQDTLGANIFEVDDTFVEVDGNLRVVDAFINHGAAQSVTLADTFNTGGNFVGGGMISNGTVTYSSSVFIWALLQESKVYRAAAGPGFAAFTLFNALAAIENETNVNLVQALILNAGVVHRRRTSGTSTVIQTIGLSMAAQTAASVSGAVMTRTTGIIGVNMAPTFNTVAGSTVNLGTITGLRLNQPAVAIFGSQAGVENITAYYGVDWANMTFGGASAISSVIRSNQASGTNRRFLDHTGNAVSRLRGNLDFDADLIGVRFGASQDVFQAYAPGTDSLFFQFLTNVDQLHFSNPADGAVLFQGGAAGAALQELRLNFDRMAFGTSGAVGNQAFTFQQNARTVTVGGGYATVLFTAAANLNLGVLAMSDVSAWVVNALSFDNTAYSITELATFKVGGMTTSNPGGTVTSRAAFWSTGRFLQRGSVQYVPITPAALASGNVNDWAGLLTNSPNNNTRRWARISGDAVTSVLTGIDATAVQDGDTFELTNVSANSIDITNQDAASVAANRIITGTGATFALGADRTVTIRYDSTTARWRLLERT